MTREQWIAECAARFSWAWGYSNEAAMSCAIVEFNIACRDEPMDDSPELPVDRWPSPMEKADDAANEWGAAQ